jgi:preprotein translocase subunit SecD
MRALPGIILGLLVASAAFSAEPIRSPTNSLNFFAVSEGPLKGGRYLNTPEFPKLGYISNSPSLVVTRLKSVATNSHTFISRYQGKTTESVEKVVEVTLLPSDAKKFTKLTEDSFGRQVLIMLGDRPLLAPRIMQPIETPTIAIRVGTQNDFHAVERELRRLAPDE